jgi:hypothetical protein
VLACASFSRAVLALALLVCFANKTRTESSANVPAAEAGAIELIEPAVSKSDTAIELAKHLFAFLENFIHAPL